MHTNLVRSTRLQTALHKRNIAIAAQHLVVGYGVLTIRAIGKDIHLQPILGATADISCNSALVLGDIAPYECHIAAIDGVVEKLLGKRGVSPLILGYNQQSRCILVDTMHQSRTGVALGEHRQILKVVRQGVHQRTAMVAHTGVNDHTRLLVYYNDVVILVDNVKRDILRHNLLLTAGIGQDDRYLVEGLNLVARLLRLAIYKDVLAIGSRLNTVARGVFKAYCKILIEAHHRLPLIDRYGEVFVHLIALVRRLLLQKVDIFG